jgi:hypothetical protein
LPEGADRECLAEVKNVVNPPSSFVFWFGQILPIVEMLSGVIKAARLEEIKK